MTALVQMHRTTMERDLKGNLQKKTMLLILPVSCCPVTTGSAVHRTMSYPSSPLDDRSVSFFVLFLPVFQSEYKEV